MNECNYLGCLYNEDGHCKYDEAPLKFPSCRVCYEEDLDRHVEEI